MSALNGISNNDLDIAYQRAQEMLRTLKPMRHRVRDQWMRQVMATAAVWNELQERWAGVPMPFEVGVNVRFKDTSRRWKEGTAYQPVTYLRHVFDVGTRRGKWQLTIYVEPPELYFGEMEKISKINEDKKDDLTSPQS